MSEQVVVAALSIVPATLLAAATLVQSIRNGRAVEATHKTVDGRMTDLLTVTRQAAKDSATLVEKTRQKHEAADKQEVRKATAARNRKKA